MPRCPACFKPMTRVEEDAIKSAVCGGCFGTWISAGSLMRRTQLDVRLTREFAAGTGQANASVAALNGTSLADLADIVQASDNCEMLRCAACEKPMVKEHFHSMIPVRVGRCKACGFVWLDAGKMMLVRKLYAELMTTTDPEIIRRRDKIASVAAAWQGHEIAVREAREATFKESNSTEDAFDFLEYLMRMAR